MKRHQLAINKRVERMQRDEMAIQLLRSIASEAMQPANKVREVADAFESIADTLAVYADDPNEQRKMLMVVCELYPTLVERVEADLPDGIAP